MNVKTKKIVKPDAIVEDSWSGFINIVTNGADIGVKNIRAKRDNKKRLDQVKLDKICRNDSIAVKICEIYAGDMVGQGIDINNSNSKKFYDFYDLYSWEVVLAEAVFYNYFFGGGAIILDVDDGKDINQWNEPLDENNIRGLNDIFAVDRYFLQPVDYNNPLKEPETYWLMYGERQIEIHKSRLIKFPGLNSGKRNKYQNNSWGESLIFRAITEIDNYHDTHDKVPDIAEQYLTNMFKFKNMMKEIKEGNGKKIKEKARYLQAVKNPLGALVIDADDDYIAKTVQTAGIGELVRQPERKLCAAVSLTHTRLLEESPGGGLTNNGGDSEQSNQHNKRIKGEQVKYIIPAYNTFNKIAQLVMKLGKKPIKYELNPLRQESKTEIIDNRYKSAQTKNIYNEMSNGLLAPEILEQTFGQGYYSDEISLTPEQIALVRKSVNEIRNKVPNNTSNNSDVNQPISNNQEVVNNAK
jgi:phage-related protein (TIGR01555 family)